LKASDFGHNRTLEKSPSIANDRFQYNMKKTSVEVQGKFLTNFSFSVKENTPEFLLPWLTDWLRSYIFSGADFFDGQFVQFGYWKILCKINGTQLHLLGPDSLAMPIKWIDDLSAVFHSTMVHKYMPESYGLEIDIPKATDTVTVGWDFDKFPMFINRMIRIKNSMDSGWFFGSKSDGIDNNDLSQLSVMSLHEATLRAPWIHDFVSLPVDTQVIFDDAIPVVLRDYSPVQPASGSYMAHRLTQRSTL